MILSCLNSTDISKSTCHVAGIWVSTGVKKDVVSPFRELPVERGMQTGGQAVEKGAMTGEVRGTSGLVGRARLPDLGARRCVFDEVTLKRRPKDRQRFSR